MLDQDSPRWKASSTGKALFFLDIEILLVIPLHAWSFMYKYWFMKVIFTWMEGKCRENSTRSCLDDPQGQYCIDSDSSKSSRTMAKVNCAYECRNGKRKHLESSSDDSDPNAEHPINGILLWHNAIKNELNEIAKEARKIQLSGNFTNLSAFNERLHFIAEVCIFHRWYFLLLS